MTFSSEEKKFKFVKNVIKNVITFLTNLNFFSSEEKVMTISELIFVIMFLAQALNSIKNINLSMPI